MLNHTLFDAVDKVLQKCADIFPAVLRLFVLNGLLLILFLTLTNLDKNNRFNSFADMFIIELTLNEQFVQHLVNNIPLLIEYLPVFGAVDFS